MCIRDRCYTVQSSRKTVDVQTHARRTHAFSATTTDSYKTQQRGKTYIRSVVRTLLLRDEQKHEIFSLSKTILITYIPYCYYRNVHFVILHNVFYNIITVLHKQACSRVVLKV